MSAIAGSSVAIRALAPHEWDTWYGRFERALGGVPKAPEERRLWQTLTEVDRSLAAWDGEEIVGTAGAFSFQVSVPGGALVAAAGVTTVSVQPTHRRRGLLRALMRRQLDDVRDRGECLAILTASEPAIYGRYGYGSAAGRLSLTIDSTRVRLRVPDGTDAARLRLFPPGQVRDQCEALYAQRVRSRPGGVARGPGWDRLPVLDAAADHTGRSTVQCVTAEIDGEFAGYARYSTEPVWAVNGAEGVVHVRDVEASSPQAYAALWRYLLDLDLTSSVVAENRPTDDPLMHMVSDIRRCDARVLDSLYLRLVDVGGALAARTYASPVDIVIEVEDEFCPWNTGRWHLCADEKGAEVTRTRLPAALTLSVGELGAAYLGGVNLHGLASAGQVRELRIGALDHAARALRSTTAPWLPYTAF